MSVYWFWKGYRSLKTDDDRWARQMFGISLKVLLVFSVLLATNAILP
jgi:heme O synthase-like polyprenyltransferase